MNIHELDNLNANSIVLIALEIIFARFGIHKQNLCID